MRMTESLLKFIQDHAEDDVSQLLLNASRYQDVDVKTAVVQIKARKQIKDKLPEWCKEDRLIFPSTLAAEQCSSETTASYKQRLVHHDDWLCDLTGGLGVDTFYLAKKARRVTYIEKNKVCCEATKANFHRLGATNVHIINGDAIDFLKNKNEDNTGIDVFYIDPSRRSTDNKRLFAISDCEPDLMGIISLLPKCYKIIIKLSPMLDITQVLTQIPSVIEVHVLSVKNECKELLLVAESDPSPCERICDPSDASDTLPKRICEPCDVADTLPKRIYEPCDVNLSKADPVIVCINYPTNNIEQSFSFRLSDEQTPILKSANHPSDKSLPSCDTVLAKSIGRFLYEPNTSILKAGAYKSVAWRYGVEKLHTNSHLYVSNQAIMSFPGRLFEITDVFPFNNRMCKTICSLIPQANISVRNFPLSVVELRKRTRISEGGDIYLFATTLSDNQKALIKCQKVNESIGQF